MVVDRVVVHAAGRLLGERAVAAVHALDRPDDGSSTCASTDQRTSTGPLPMFAARCPKRRHTRAPCSSISLLKHEEPSGAESPKIGSGCPNVATLGASTSRSGSIRRSGRTGGASSFSASPSNASTGWAISGISGLKLT